MQSRHDRLLEEHACAKVLLRFFRALDTFDYDECLALFVEDATWERKGIPLQGLGQIRATLEARPRSVVICHQISNVEVDIINEDQATLHYVLVGYEARLKDDGSRPVGGLGGIRRGRDLMVRTPDGWKFKHKGSDGVMLGVLPA